MRERPRRTDTRDCVPRVDRSGEGRPFRARFDGCDVCDGWEAELRCDAWEKGFGECGVRGCEVREWAVGACEGGFEEGCELFGEEVFVGWCSGEEDVGYSI